MSLAPPAQILKETVGFYLRLIAIDLQNCFFWLPVPMAKKKTGCIPQYRHARLWKLIKKPLWPLLDWLSWPGMSLLGDAANLLLGLGWLHFVAWHADLCCQPAVLLWLWLLLLMSDCYHNTGSLTIPLQLDLQCILCLSAQSNCLFKNSLILLTIHLHVQPFICNHSPMYLPLSTIHAFMQPPIVYCSLTHFLTVSFSQSVTPMHVFTYPLIHSPVQSALCSFKRS